MGSVETSRASPFWIHRWSNTVDLALDCAWRRVTDIVERYFISSSCGCLCSFVAPGMLFIHFSVQVYSRPGSYGLARTSLDSLAGCLAGSPLDGVYYYYPLC